MTETNIQELAEKIIADVKAGKLVLEGVADVKEAWKNASGFFSKIMAAAKAIGKLVYNAIKYVEQLGADLALAGAQKKELAVTVINKLLDIPWLNEGTEAMLIGFAVDVAVTVLNERLGHKWISVNLP